MSCTFNLPFTGSVAESLQKAKSAVEGQSGTFNGDENSGEFALSVFGNNIAGSYTVTGHMLNIIISDKPFMVPCSMIESFLQKQIS
ncbi:MAG: hypothetical protein JWQ27_550 [Ferruginibacter sp.]|nr:hypothetical protein [Ferruginibacter sp.]